MTQHLYYQDSFLDAFDAEVRELQPATAKELRPALILDRTAFYPTSGGQVFDTGWIVPADAANAEARLRVTEVDDTEDGRVIHYLEAPLRDVRPGARVRGQIDSERRRDHI